MPFSLDDALPKKRTLPVLPADVTYTLRADRAVFHIPLPSSEMAQLVVHVPNAETLVCALRAGGRTAATETLTSRADDGHLPLVLRAGGTGAPPPTVGLEHITHLLLRDHLLQIGLTNQQTDPLVWAELIHIRADKNTSLGQVFTSVRELEELAAPRDRVAARNAAVAAINVWI